MSKIISYLLFVLMIFFQSVYFSSELKVIYQKIKDDQQKEVAEQKRVMYEMKKKIDELSEAVKYLKTHNIDVLKSDIQQCRELVQRRIQNEDEGNDTIGNVHKFMLILILHMILI